MLALTSGRAGHLRLASPAARETLRATCELILVTVFLRIVLRHCSTRHGYTLTRVRLECMPVRPCLWLAEEQSACTRAVVGLDKHSRTRPSRYGADKLFYFTQHSQQAAECDGVLVRTMFAREEHVNGEVRHVLFPSLAKPTRTPLT